MINSISVKMIRGISSVKENSCYAVSIIQCLRRSIGLELFSDVDDIISRISGKPEDAHEYYDELISKLPPDVREQIILQVEDDTTKEPKHWTNHIRFTSDLEKLCSNILEHRNVICVYRNGVFDRNTCQGGISSIDIHKCMILGLRSKHGMDRMRACAFVCGVPGHYYALVSDPQYSDRSLNAWLICDGPTVRPSNTWIHPVYMIFYSRI